MSSLQKILLTVFWMLAVFLCLLRKSTNRKEVSHALQRQDFSSRKSSVVYGDCSSRPSAQCSRCHSWRSSSVSCLQPRVAFLDERVSPARVLFKMKAAWSIFDHLPEGVRSILIPCGKCFGCLKSRALDITVRAVAESRMHDFSSFVTLTCDDSHFPLVFPSGLHHRPWQLFAKRLRKKIGKFSFLMCGEYGARTMRPHYHAVIFGHRFVDGYVDDSFGYVPSRVLRDCWSNGNVMVDDLSVERCAYVAGYTCKDYSLGRDRRFYESRGLGLPYVKWSRRPALGLRWFDRYHDDLLDDDCNLTFVLNGKRFCFGGRYFYNRFRLQFPSEFDRIRASRLNRQSELDITGIMRHYEDNRRACQVRQYNLMRKKELADL